jgi:hypothetical protein
MLGYAYRRQRAGQGGRLLRKSGALARKTGTTAGASEVAKAAWQESCGGDCAAVRQPVRDCRRKPRGREKPSHQGWRTGKGSGICAGPKARSACLRASCRRGWVPSLPSLRQRRLCLSAAVLARRHGSMPARQSPEMALALASSASVVPTELPRRSVRTTA